MARKTIAVDALRNKVNGYLRDSHDDRTEARIALHVLLESVLMETDNYKGFTYRIDEFETDAAGVPTRLRDVYDDTRRIYF